MIGAQPRKTSRTGLTRRRDLRSTRESRRGRVQDIYDSILVAEKSLYWINGTDRRFNGYNFFGLHPEIPIEWIDKHIS